MLVDGMHWTVQSLKAVYLSLSNSLTFWFYVFMFIFALTIGLTLLCSALTIGVLFMYIHFQEEK